MHAAAALRPFTAFDHIALAARTGDRAATELFLQRLQEQVQRAVQRRARMCGGLGPDADDQADLVQDLLIELWQRELHAWEPARGAFLTYAKLRLHWRVADHVRKASRFDADVDVYDAVEAPGADPESLLWRAERDAQIRSLEGVVRRLPARERALVRAVDLDERPLTAVAKKKRMHVSNACRIRQRAHVQIARAMAA